MDELHYLYKITCLVNNKIYIGQAKDYNQRWRQHKAEAKKDNPSMIINKAMKKYGIDNFVFEIIATCKTFENTNEVETILVKQYESHISTGKGYNVSNGGSNAPKTEEWKAAMSAIKGGWIGKDHTEENKEKFRQYHLGSTHSEETILKQSETMKQKCADGWVQKTRFEPGEERTAVWKGKTLSEEHRRAISEGNIGHEVSEETRRKISESQIGKIISEEQRKQMSEFRKGNHYSPETEFQKGLIPWNKGMKMGPSPKKGIKTGISPPNKGQVKTLSQSQIDEIKKLLSSGLSIRKIGEQIGVNRHFISKELKRTSNNE